jgi:hypothetical protein
VWSPATTGLHYPSHPFKPDLCKQISNLPVGFADLALTTKISVELIEVLNQLVTSWKQEGPSPRFATGYWPANKILDAPKMTTVERLIAVALLALCNYIDKNTFGHASPIHHMRQQAQIEVLATDKNISACNKEVLEWAAHVLCATTSAGSESHQWAGRVVQWRPLSEERKRELEEMFFVIPP